MRVVRVLIFVDEDVAESPVVVLGNGPILFEKLNGAHDEIIEIEGVRFAQALLIVAVDVCNGLRNWIVWCDLRVFTRRDEVVLEVRNTRLKHFGAEPFGVDVLGTCNHGDETVGVLLVVNGERGAQARRLVLLTQNAHARGVESEYPHAARLGAD